jgi:hypothetical protein
MESEERTTPVACFKGPVGDFLDTSYEHWLEETRGKYGHLCNEAPSTAQVDAWGDCYRKIKPVLESASNGELFLVFEYELPREGGRRPDLIILSERDVLVIEFNQ